MILFVSSVLAANIQGLVYPPPDVPAYLVCSFRSKGMTDTPNVGQSLALYFPSGVSKADTENRVQDSHGLLKGQKLNFSIRAANHWSLYSKSGKSTPKPASDLSITFLPAKVGGPLYEAAIAIGMKIERTGYCFGLVGPESSSAFEDAVANPKSLDKLK